MNCFCFSSSFLIGAMVTWGQNSSALSLPEAKLGQPYRNELPKTGSAGGHSATLLVGTLPDGLSLSGEGVVSGTPQESGLFRFKVRSAGSERVAGVQDVVLQVDNENGLTIPNASLQTAELDVVYQTSLRAEGGTAPYSWEIDSSGGALPAGLEIRSSGELRGTPQQSGAYSLLLRVTDASGVSYVRQVSISVQSQAISFNTTSLAGAFLNVPYRQELVAGGGSGGYEYTLVSGSLPPGLTLSTAGLLSGTPTLIGSYPFTVQAKDSVNSVVQASYTAMVVLSGPRITSTTLPTGILSQAYNFALLSEGGNTPYTFRLLSGVLPPGLQLNDNGTLTGTPTVTGIYPVTVRVTDGGGQQSQLDLRFNVNSSAFQITTTALSAGSVGIPYSASLNSSSGTGPFVYSLLRGAFPAGLTLNSDGSLTGTPTSSGTFNFEISARDSRGATAQVPITLVIQSSALRFFSRGLSNAQFGQAYSSTLLTVNGISPLTFNIVQGSLPPGLTLSSNGNISGTPTSSGLYQITYRVLDAQQNAAQITLPIYVNSSGLMLRTLTLPSGQANQAYNTALEAAGGTGPYLFEVTSGALPTGLSLSSTGVLTGTPTSNAGAAFTVRVKDATNATSSVAYQFNLNGGVINLDGSSAPVVETANPYTFNYVSRGGSGGYIYSIESGTLPPGLTLSPTGVISGDSGASGVYVYNLRVTDSSGASSLFNQVIRVASRQLGFITNRLREVNTGVPYFSAFSAVNGIGPYRFAITNGTLPTGITLDANGNLSGTTSVVGTYPLTVQVTDSTGATATTQAQIVVTSGYPFQIVTTDLPAAKVGTAYSFNVTSALGKEPYTFQVERGSVLPEGLRLSSAGALTGTPVLSGTSSFVISSRDENGFVVRRTFTLKVD